MARPIAKDHDAKRTAILHAAARLFANEGYGRASMAQVAAACNISKANIYHYYSGKEALLFDILETHLKGLRDHLCNFHFADPTSTHCLKEFMTEVLLQYQGADAEHDVMQDAMKALPLEHQALLRAYQRDITGELETILRRILPNDIGQDAEKMKTIVMSIFGMLNWHYKWNKGADAKKRTVQAGIMSELVLNGLQSLNVTKIY